jgi:hypothetical protein
MSPAPGTGTATLVDPLNGRTRCVVQSETRNVPYMAKKRGGKPTRVKRDLRGEFFEVSIQTGAPMATILQEVMDMPTEARALDIRAQDVRLQRLREAHGLIEGDLMTVVYHGDVPVMANRDGDEEPIALGDGQGFGYGTAFLYDPKTHWMLLQSSRHSVAAIDVVFYLHQARKRPLFEFEIRPIPRPDETARLKKLDRFTALSVTVSGIGSNLFGSAKGVLGEAFTDPEAPGAETIHILVSNKDGLDESWTKRMWGLITNAKAEQTGTLRVDESKLVGTIEGVRRSQVLSLLDLNLAATAKVEIGPERYMTFEARIQALRDMWAQCQHLRGGLPGVPP